MKLLLLFLSALLLAGCHYNGYNNGQVRRHTTPGHVQQYTGCNYASGKCKFAQRHPVPKYRGYDHGRYDKDLLKGHDEHGKGLGKGHDEHGEGHGYGHDKGDRGVRRGHEEHGEGKGLGHDKHDEDFDIDHDKLKKDHSKSLEKDFDEVGFVILTSL